MAPMRLGGLSSGLDADKMVRDMMKVERLKVDKVEKERTRIEWTQSAMRELINKTREFQGKFFDVLKPESNMLSGQLYSAFDYSVTSMGVATSAVQITARTGATRLNNTIDSITQLASADTWKGAVSNLASIRSSKGVDIDALKSGGDLEFSVAIERKVKKITLKQDELAALGSVEDLAAKVNEKIKLAFGNDYANLVSAVDAEGGKGLRIALGGSEVKLFRAGDNPLFKQLNIANGSSTYDYKTKSVQSLLGIKPEDLENFKIGDTQIKLDAEMTIEQMFKAINDAGVGIEMHYDSLADRITMRSKETGSIHDIQIEDGSAAERLFAKLFRVDDLVDANGALSAAAGASVERQNGKNAILSLNGTQIIKSSNKFTIDGISYALNATSAQPIETAAKIDADKVVEKIKTFVDEYNSLIELIDKKLLEPKHRGYDPLTEEEKLEITEKQAEKIEEKAKSGILNGNRDLQKMLDSIRSVIVDTVDGDTLRSIGISSKSWKDKGRLYVDTVQLKDAIQNDANRVVEIFTKQSEIKYTDEANRKQRYAENGVMARLDDVIKDFTRTTRDKEGKKGSLVMIAGLEDDSSVLTNKMSKEMRDKDKRINEMLKRLAQKEDYYYSMFAKMEAAMAKLQSQQNSFAGLMGGMNG